MKIVEKYEMSYIRKMGNYESHETENELIILLPVGCFWAKKSGGCSYCGYQVLVGEMLETTEQMPYTDIVRHELSKQTEPIHRVSIFVGGSFLEIPEAERLAIISIFNEYPDIKDVFFETRPELITEDNIRHIIEAAPRKKITVGIGLESSNEKVRNEVHKKGMPTEVFEKAMRILTKMGIRALMYVFVKPAIPNMSDEEAIIDALETIKYSFEQGAYAIELECGYIVENSDMYDLYIKGMYKPLTLWSVKELLEKAIKLNSGIIRLAYFSDTPKPIAGPSNCDKCNDEFFEMFDRYRCTMDTGILKREIVCGCKY